MACHSITEVKDTRQRRLRHQESKQYARGAARRCVLGGALLREVNQLLIRMEPSPPRGRS